MTDENGLPEDDEERRPGGLLGAIRQIVDALAEAERDERTTFGETGRIPGGHFTTEYGFSGQIGGPRRRRESRSDSRSSGSRSGSPSTAGSTDGSADRHLIDVRETDDELLVVADLPDVAREDVTTGIDQERDELVVAVADETVERIALPWPVEDVDGRFRHGVLELRFSRTEDGR